MAKLPLDWNPDHPDQPRRGDVMQSPKQAYLVLSVRRTKRRVEAGPRFLVIMLREREMEAEPGLREALLRSAGRRGGSRVFPFHWYPRKKKSRTFEGLMRGERHGI